MSVVLFFIGGFLTSFFVCLIERRDRGENWWSERSECNFCHRKLMPYELVPVLSYIFLGGASRCCHQSIPKRYFWYELIGCLLLALLGNRYGLEPQLIFYSITTMGLYYLSLEDLNSKSYYTVDYFIVLFMIIISAKLLQVEIYFFSGLFLFILLYLISKLFPEGMGEGDPWVGFIVGFISPTIWTAYIGFTLAFGIGALIGLYLRSKGYSLKSELPFVPCLALSAFILILTF